MTDQSWIPKKGQKRKDGYQTVAKRLLHTLETDREGRISWGKKIPKFNLQETLLNCSKESPAPYWQEAIASVDAIPIYTDGSKSETGVVGGRYWFSQGKLGIRVGERATVWDGEIAGLERGIKAAGNRDWKILLLTDSKAAIQATQKARRTGKARTRALAALGSEIHTRLNQYGPENVRIAWVKAHVGIPGNEEVDKLEQQKILVGKSLRAASNRGIEK